MRLVFYQPLLWLRMLKLIQQMYMRNDAIAILTCQIHWQHGLHLLIRSEAQSLRVSMQASQFKCWDVPVNTKIAFDRLPLDQMLSFLQRFEAVMLQKFYTQIGIVWEWKFSDSTCCDLQMRMLRNDNMEEMEGATFAIEPIALVSPPTQQVLNAHMLFGHDRTNASKPLTDGHASSYWQKNVHPFPYDEGMAPNFGSTTTTTPPIQYKVITEELKRMLNEWLLMPPQTRMQFQEDRLNIEAGDSRAVYAIHTIPYAARVFVLQRFLPHELRFDTLSLMDFHRFLNCLPNEWSDHVLWKVDPTKQNLTWQIVNRNGFKNCGQPDWFEFTAGTTVLV